MVSTSVGVPCCGLLIFSIFGEKFPFEIMYLKYKVDMPHPSSEELSFNDSNDVGAPRCLDGIFESTASLGNHFLNTLGQSIYGYGNLPFSSPNVLILSVIQHGPNHVLVSSDSVGFSFCQYTQY